MTNHYVTLPFTQNERSHINKVWIFSSLSFVEGIDLFRDDKAINVFLSRLFYFCRAKSAAQCIIRMPQNRKRDEKITDLSTGKGLISHPQHAQKRFISRCFNISLLLYFPSQPCLLGSSRSRAKKEKAMTHQLGSEFTTFFVSLFFCYKSDKHPWTPNGAQKKRKTLDSFSIYEDELF